MKQSEKLEWWTVEMSYQSGPAKRTTVTGTFLAKDGMEALAKGDRWMSGEGIKEYSLKIVGDTVPLGERHSPAPVLNKEVLDTDTGELSAEEEVVLCEMIGDNKSPKEKVTVPLDIKRHLYLYPLAITVKPYTYKEDGL